MIYRREKRSMEYSYQSPPPNANSGWMGHHLSFYLKPSRTDELLEFVEKMIGPKHTLWRLHYEPGSVAWEDKSVLKFSQKDHAMLIKLSWEEDPNPLESTRQYFQLLAKSLSNINYTAPLRGVGTTISQKSQLNQFYGAVGNQGVRNKPFYTSLSEVENVWLTQLFPSPFPVIKGSRKTRNLSLCRARGLKIMSTEELEDYLNENQK